MTKFTFETDSFSDLHKDVYGFRPRDHRFFDENITDEEKQEIWDYTCEMLDFEMTRMEQEEIEADIEFEKLIQECCDCGASDRETAIRWILEGDLMDEMDYAYGFTYVSYNFGISNSYAPEIMSIINNITSERLNYETDYN